jgi:hypothetical protein
MDSSGSVIGGLEICLGEDVFPGKGYTDFVVPVLGWWLKELNRIDSAQNATGRFIFMDAGHQWTAQLSSGAYACKFRLSNGPIVERLVASDQLKLGLLQGGHDLVTALAADGLESSAVRDLRDTVASLAEQWRPGGR